MQYCIIYCKEKKKFEKATYCIINFRFSSKTLMSLLPADELKKIEDKVEKGEMTVDFYDILGEVQKNKPAA